MFGGVDVDVACRVREAVGCGIGSVCVLAVAVVERCLGDRLLHCKGANRLVSHARRVASWSRQTVGTGEFSTVEA